MLERTGIQHVDVLSLDVEGHEASVLEGVNFSSISFGVILMERSFRTCPRSCMLLRRAGYAELSDRSVLDGAWVPQAQATPVPYRCRPYREAGHCRGWDYRGAPDYLTSST